MKRSGLQLGLDVVLDRTRRLQQAPACTYNMRQLDQSSGSNYYAIIHEVSWIKAYPYSCAFRIPSRSVLESAHGADIVPGVSGKRSAGTAELRDPNPGSDAT